MGIFNKKTAVLSILVGVWALWLYGCAKPAPPVRPPGHPKPYRVGKNWYQPLSHAKGFKQKGIASWYGKKFHGRKTSNGEIYNMYAVSAAHKTLPLGTFVRVTNLENGKDIDVRINDRGPFVRGRIIDLSYKAAKEIGIVGPGTARVEVIALGMAPKGSGTQDAIKSYVPVDYEKGTFSIQVGSFLEKENAKRLRTKLDKKYKNAHIKTYFDGYQTFYRVRVGKCSTLSNALEYEQIMIDQGFLGAMIVAE
jgi:peptidoglycan lytic transglycosylase